ncbi:MAG: hypothetical protein KatS3mg040_0469 [Candidatus Kapaibacterium sp.]|nr:MAG: hypothetical protein KatS3mg040_0469 [Candidatus Kapabacteria bacterium]
MHHITLAGKLPYALVCIVAAVLVGGCSTTHVVIHRHQLDSASLARLNVLLEGADVEVELRGGATSPALQQRRRARLTARALELAGERDTLAIPLEYVATVRGSDPRSGSRVAVGSVGGFFIGTALGIFLTPAAPLQIGVLGALCGLTAAALISEQFLLRFE